MATHAETMVTLLEGLMQANPGVETVIVDGRTMAFADLIKQYEHWKKRVAIESGARPRSATINLGNT
jgi:hypothetical protein